MGAIRGALEFVVGDDWRVALGVAGTLAATALIAAMGLPAWWLGPLTTLAILHRSVRRAAPHRDPDLIQPSRPR